MNDKIIDRVRKLLAMAKDTSSPNEAAIAAQRARKLIDEYQLSELDLTTVDANAFSSETYNTGQKTLNRALSIMAVAVAKYNDCQTEATSLGGAINIRFKGMLVDAVCATEMFKYLRDEMYRQAERNAEGRANRTAYRLGFASGITAQVRESMRQRVHLKTSTGTNLVSCKNQLVVGHFGETRYKRDKVRFSSNGAQSFFNQGKERGQNTNLSRQVTGNPQKAIAN